MKETEVVAKGLVCGLPTELASEDSPLPIEVEAVPRVGTLDREKPG